MVGAGATLGESVQAGRIAPAIAAECVVPLFACAPRDCKSRARPRLGGAWMEPGGAHLLSMNPRRRVITVSRSASVP